MADNKNLQPLIRRMLISDDLLPETVEELQEYREQLDRTGSLDPMDVDYVKGLARRLGLDSKSARPDEGGPDEAPAAANDGGVDPHAAVARARELVGMLYHSETGLNAEVSDERAAEILEEVLQSLDAADTAISRR